MRGSSTRARLHLDAGHDAGVALLAPVGRCPIDEYDEAVAEADVLADLKARVRAVSPGPVSWPAGARDLDREGQDLPGAGPVGQPVEVDSEEPSKPE